MALTGLPTQAAGASPAKDAPAAFSLQLTFAAMIDTLETQRSLLRSGFSEQQADTLVQALKAAEERAVTGEEFQRGLEDLRRDLTIKMYAVGVAVSGVVIGALSLIMSL